MPIEGGVRYRGPKQPPAAGPNPGYRIDEGKILPKKDVFKSDLELMEHRLERRIGAMAGFIIFVLVGLVI